MLTNGCARFNYADAKQFTQLVGAAAASRFDATREQSSSAEYFNYYALLSQQQNMLSDLTRTGTYQRAVLANSVDFRNKVVCDVGAGTGILSFFALQAGARKVYAIEASNMADNAQLLVEANGLADRMTVVKGRCEDIELPEPVDIIISEPMGIALLNERMLESYLAARRWYVYVCWFCSLCLWLR